MTDVRFNRLAVSIFDTAPLAWYFTNSERMKRATIYCDVYEQWKGTETDDILKTAKFLETLYKQEPNRLVNLLSYIVDDLPNHYYTFYYRPPTALSPVYNLHERRNIIMKQLSWFFFELETMGITRDEKSFQLAVGTTGLDIEIRTRLESMLSELGEEYLARYQGAIEALMSDNPDKFSQSISSMRELLTSILDLLTKDDEFTKDERSEKGAPKRKAKIKHILAKSSGLGRESELAEAIANTLDETYSALSKQYHVTAKKDWGTVLFCFKSTEYLIYYIILQKHNQGLNN